MYLTFTFHFPNRKVWAPVSVPVGAMPLWGKSQKSPTDVVRAIRDGLTALEKGDKKTDKVDKNAPKTTDVTLLACILLFLGDGENEIQT